MASASVDKFALLAIATDVVDLQQHLEMMPGLWASTRRPFDFDEFWQNHLGQGRNEDFESATLFIYRAVPSLTATIIDAETHVLEADVKRLWTGLQLSARFHCDNDPILVSGSMAAGGAEARQVSVLSACRTLPCSQRDEITVEHILNAAMISRSLQSAAERRTHRRLFRALQIYQNAIIRADVFDQLHQCARSIEGLLIAGPGESGARFKSRTELFIGPKHHDFMGDVYNLRSAIEHVNEHVEFDTWSRDRRIEILQRAVVIEVIARTVLGRIFENEDMLDHFATDDSIRHFWSLTRDQQITAWGAHLDVATAATRLDKICIEDRDIGL